jgi:hypothetical protein
MKFMMQKMMPMMSGTIRNMEFVEKEKMMDTMMPHMMANMSFEEKMQMMCPKCLSVATSEVSESDKDALKAQMSEVFANI